MWFAVGVFIRGTVLFCFFFPVLGCLGCFNLEVLFGVKCDRAVFWLFGVSRALDAVFFEWSRRLVSDLTVYRIVSERRRYHFAFLERVRYSLIVLKGSL